VKVLGKIDSFNML